MAESIAFFVLEAEIPFIGSLNSSEGNLDLSEIIARRTNSIRERRQSAARR